MATNEDQGYRWLVGSLAWERSFSRLRDAAAAPEVVILEEAPEPAGTPRRVDRRSAGERPRRVHVDAGVPTSA